MSSMAIDCVDIDAILPLVRKPGRYLGGELNVAARDWDRAAIRFCLVFPDLYEIGMSHQGLQILYHILNRQERVLAHRCYAPDVDMEGELRRHGMPLFSLEARRPLAAYDVLGITLPYELCYTNILTILDLAGLPLRAADRTDGHPLVLGGGSCSMNPEPVADFFDAIVLGDGEEVVVEISDLLMEARAAAWPRHEILARLAGLAGVYVPSFFEPVYEGDTLVEVRPLRPDYRRVRRRVLPTLPSVDLLTRPLVPLVKPIHDRLGLEIARGCTRGCRFCQAGIIYRPVRERSLPEIMELAEQGIGSSGFDELALLSLSTGDYSCLGPLMTRLMDRFAGEYVSISMPSMRVGTLTPGIMDQIRRVRKTGFTVAPEAGTDRLREVINKGITEEDLLATCRDAVAMGWNLIKFYFMIGLPTETDEDVAAIAALAQKARGLAGQGRGGRIQINVSVATFVPKPHTPFQWHRQLSLEESRQRINRLKKLLPRRGFRLKWHDPHQSVMEGVFSRGDRRLSALIESAWRAGVRFDGWSEHYRLENWQQAAARCGLNLDHYLRGRSPDELLPWDHLESGVDREFLEIEYRRALERSYTPDCRVHGCQKCGLCDFRLIRPVLHRAEESGDAAPGPAGGNRQDPDQGFTYRVHYSRLDDARFLGHLEMLQLVFRVLRRAGLPVLFSRGFNPSPRVSFSQALPVGVESLVEYFDVELARPLADPGAARDRLNAQFPPAIRVTGIGPAPAGSRAVTVTSYRITLPEGASAGLVVRAAAFLDSRSYPVTRIRKGRARKLDLRPLVDRLDIDDATIMLDLRVYPGQAATSPREILEKVLLLDPEVALRARVLKTAVREEMGVEQEA